MIKGFFRDMPKDMREIGKWDIEVIACFPLNDSVVYSEVVEGKKWKAYLKVRLKALIKDLKTSGAYYGIAWTLNKCD